MLRLFNSKTDSIDESKMRTRDGRRVRGAVIRNDGIIALLLENGHLFTTYGNGRCYIGQEDPFDLMIEVPEPVIVKEYANDYSGWFAAWHKNINFCQTAAIHETRLTIIERTKTDGRVTAYRLVDESEYKNL